MFWPLIATVLLLTSHRCTFGRILTEQEIAEDVFQNVNNNEGEGKGGRELSEDEEEAMRAALTWMVRRPWGPRGPPLLYVEPAKMAPPDVDNSNDATLDDTVAVTKRTRYYRRYPWKRQNSRYRTYEADSSAYMCQPSRADVFNLLVALHETRAGGGAAAPQGVRAISFCNRRRSPHTVFTNLRFLG